MRAANTSVEDEYNGLFKITFAALFCKTCKLDLRVILCSWIRQENCGAKNLSRGGLIRFLDRQICPKKCTDCGFCGKLSGLADFGNTVDRASAKNFGADSEFRLS